MSDAVDLQHGLIYSIGTGPVDVAVMHLSNPALDGQPVSVVLMVATADGQERDFTLRIGDRFPAGPETWWVRGIDGVGGYDYLVRIERVDEPASAGTTIASPHPREELRRTSELSEELWEQAQERARRGEPERTRIEADDEWGDRERAD